MEFSTSSIQSSTVLLERFGNCFEGLDELVLLPIYSAGERNDSGISEKDIANLIENIPVTCIERKEEVVKSC